MKPEYGINFFKGFRLCLNALDNRKARNHVNRFLLNLSRLPTHCLTRMCLAADIPLVESGTAGYLGQVTVIRWEGQEADFNTCQYLQKLLSTHRFNSIFVLVVGPFYRKGKTECYECQPKPHQKTFPGCTIRNTPRCQKVSKSLNVDNTCFFNYSLSEPVHCIVWAKHLFNQLFGEADPDEDVSPDTEDPEASGEDAGKKVEFPHPRMHNKISVLRLLVRRERRREEQPAMLRGGAPAPGLRIADTTPRSFSRSSSTMTSSENQHF